ncbi:hypothetical protein [Luteimonas aquatica]|uniref:hypothetical protein n=1 Tax=Luteimonas aquatica TaxID=450364 RepID=UPI001F55B8AB|nr:hypothetical protein [Luteimonas aquatica]
MDKDALIVEIGRLIVSDPKVASKPWDKYALVAWYGDGVSKLNGFRYLGEDAAQPATPAGLELEGRLDALREATRLDGQAPWRACVVKLDRGTGKAVVDFEYDDPERWHVTPSTAAEIARRARP